MSKVIASLIAAAVIAGGLLATRTANAARTRSGVQTVDPEQPAFNPPSGSAGLRNNNPFNLEFRDIGWRGEIGTDGRFSIFDTALNGLRAGMKNIHTKFTRDGIRTVRKLLNVLSPKIENPTENFIAFVSRRIERAPDQPLNFQAVILPLSKAIVSFETGVPNGGFSDELYEKALRETGIV